MVYAVLLVVLVAVVLVVTMPLWRPRAASPARTEPDELQRSADVLELEAARDAKYREIRDADLDHQTGKLSDADFEAVDRTLRAEAIAILRRLDDARDRASGSH
jgi:hypothetical protein